MMVVGLTGGIAAGKSTVTEYLRKLGAAIIDADKISKELTEVGSPTLHEIADAFGKDILDVSGCLNRKKLAERIFKSTTEREKLNIILHPRIFQEIKERIAYYRTKSDVPLIVLDVPLLLETGMQSMADEVWVVAVSPEVQLARLMERDGITKEMARDRIASQMPLEEKIKLADRVIDNSGGIPELHNSIDKLWAEVVRSS